MAGLRLPPALEAALTGVKQNMAAGPSVLAPWYQHPMQIIGNLLGVGDASQVMATPEVTTFINNGVPDIAARSAATTKAMGAMRRTLMGLGMAPDVLDATTTIAAKYPRVMAHVDDVYRPGRLERVLNGVNKNVAGQQLDGSLPGRSELAIYRNTVNPSSLDYANTFFHELTHAAQNVGLKGDFTPEYNMSDKVYKYRTNPFEQSANAVAARRLAMIQQALQTKR